MKAYSAFSGIYDRCMDNVPYDEWAAAIVRLLNDAGIAPGSLVCDLGCGTGEMTERLRRAGFDMIGIDASEEMLAIAQEKEYDRIDALLTEAEATSDDISAVEEEAIAQMIRYLHQDIREMELYGTVSAFVCVCDTMNYLLKEEDLTTVFRLANNYLERGGLFLFDMKTAHYYRDVLGYRTRMEDYGDAVLLWDNAYSEKNGINEYRLTMFLRENGDSEEGAASEGKSASEDSEGDARYIREDELHTQRAYSISKVKELLEAAGMEYVTAMDGYTGKPATEASERVLFLAKEKFQEKKYYE